jgi:hypothetical protein
MEKIPSKFSAWQDLWFTLGGGMVLLLPLIGLLLVLLLLV